MLALRLYEYKIAGSNQTVGHLRRLMAAVNAMRNSRVPGVRNVGGVYTFLGPGIDCVWHRVQVIIVTSSL